MALQGQFEDEFGVNHANAYGMAGGNGHPLAIYTYPPESSLCRFDFNIWHDLQAMLDDKRPIAQIPFSVAGFELFNFISTTETQIQAGAGMVAAIVGQMQTVVKQDPRFSEWVETA